MGWRDFFFSILVEVVMIKKILNELSLEKLTLLDSINLEVFLGIFVSFFNFRIQIQNI
jgi:hypothetical protein